MLKRFLYQLYERRLLAEVKERAMPHHLGLIQDGNRRFAQEAGISKLEGYRYAAAKTEEVLTWCTELEVSMITLWWLSTENLSRHAEDVGAIVQVIEHTLAEWIHSGLTERLEIRIRPIGELELLPPSTIEALQQTESATRHHNRMLVNVGVGYGGRQEIIEAVKGYLHESFRRREAPEQILHGLTTDALNKYLYTYDCPDPDLIIRTSGEVRLSGFMLWQSAYSEYYFCDANWPAFRKVDFLRAIRTYQQRHRRFGR
jgi:short-chain Z-isoprenyl diphosphate synthase